MADELDPLSTIGTPVNQQPARILLLSVKPWPSSVRFADALKASGAVVDILCPNAHPLREVWPRKRVHIYNPRFPSNSFIAAIDAALPDILIAGDEIAIREILLIYWDRLSDRGPTDRIVGLLERSLGNPSAYESIFRRSELIEIAHTAGVCTARTRVVKRRKDLLRGAKEFGYPFLLKNDHSAGGVGIEVVSSKMAAIRALYRLKWKFVRARLAAVFRGQISFRRLFLETVLPTITLQEFVRGRPATSAFACWKGEVVGAVHVDVVQEVYPRGPATVVRLTTNSAMDDVAKKIASRLCLSGIHGLDYVRDSATGTEVLIEMNPRLTQIAHFNLGDDRDPAHGLVSAISPTHAVARPQVIQSDLIALFPQEMERDPHSEFLSSAYHDTPGIDVT